MRYEDLISMEFVFTWVVTSFSQVINYRCYREQPVTYVISVDETPLPNSANNLPYHILNMKFN